MNHQIRIGLFGITLAGALAMTSPGALAQERFVTIGTGGQTGVYYTAGQSVCRFLNRAEVKPAIKCNAPSTAGSVTNIVIDTNLNDSELVVFDSGMISVVPMATGNAGAAGNWRTVDATQPGQDGQRTRIIGDFAMEIRQSKTHMARLYNIG